jgi:hypothetical protein
MEDLLPKFEGKTGKQKNPHPRNNPAWARHGGMDDSPASSLSDFSNFI